MFAVNQVNHLYQYCATVAPCMVWCMTHYPCHTEMFVTLPTSVLQCKVRGGGYSLVVSQKVVLNTRELIEMPPVHTIFKIQC